MAKDNDSLEMSLLQAMQEFSDSQLNCLKRAVHRSVVLSAAVSVVVCTLVGSFQAYQIRQEIRTLVAQPQPPKESEVTSYDTGSPQ